MAARISNVSVLLCVVQFYKKLGYLTAALGPAGEGTAEETTAPPLHIAVMHSHYENTVLLLKESREHSPESLTATNSGIYSEWPEKEIYGRHNFRTFCELVEGGKNKLTTFSTWTIMLGCNKSFHPWS